MTKKEIKDLDDDWSRKVRARDKRCIVCGSTKSLAAHHAIVDRTVRSTRWELTNGVTLCLKCHIFNVHRKASFQIMNDFLNILVKKIKIEEIGRLLAKAEQK